MRPVKEWVRGPGDSRAGGRSAARREGWKQKRAPKPEPFRAYLREVCGHVRWRRAHGTVKRELLAHLEDQKAAFLEEGMEEAEAEREAVRDMGPAELVGQGMDGAYRPKRDWFLVLLALALIAAGVTVMVLGWLQMEGDASLKELREDEHYHYWLESLPVWMGGGLAAFLLCYLSGPAAWLRCGWVLPALYTAALCAAHGRWLDRSPKGYWNFEGDMEQFLVCLAPAMFVLVLYRFHGTDLWGAGACLILCMLFWRRYGHGYNDSEMQIAGVLLFVLFFCAFGTGWFGGYTQKCRFWFPCLLAFLFLLGAKDYLWERVNGLVHQFGRDDQWAVEILDHAKWVGASSQEIAWYLYGDRARLLTYAVYRCGLAAVPAAAVLLVLCLLRGLRDQAKQRKWLGRMMSGAAVWLPALSGATELGAALGLWAQPGMIPLAYGGGGFLASMALLGILLAVLRDAALIPGKKAEARKPGRLKAAG